MPPPTPNIGQLISRTNTGPSANVTSGSVTHSPATLTSHSGDFTTSSDGQVVEARNISGILRINNNNVKVIDSKARGVVIANDKQGIECRWCEFGNQNGNDTSNGGTTCFSGGGYTLYRCQFYGWVDLLRSRWGDQKVVECWLGPMYADPNGHTGGARAHCDPNQPHPPPGSVPFRSLLMQGCRIDSFVFESGENYLTRMGNIGNGPATCGWVNVEYGNCSNGTLRDCYIDGNYSQGLYIINGDNNNAPNPPQNWVVIDNIWKSRRNNSNHYGNTSFVNFGGAKTPYPSVTWGRNVDADTGETLAAFYKTYATGTNHSWGNTKNAGPSSQYPSFYTEPPPPPPGGAGVTITSPADGATITSGSVTFLGGADTSVGDSADNYNWFDYWVHYPNPSNPDLTVQAFVDHDSPAANTGFTFTVTGAGTTFNDRSGVSHTVLGPATLHLKGLRKDGTTATEEISVTFGNVAPPPAAGSFAPKITVTSITDFFVNQSEGGVPDSMVKTLIRFKPTPDPESYAVHRVTGEELVRSGGRWILKGSDQ